MQAHACEVGYHLIVRVHACEVGIVVRGFLSRGSQCEGLHQCMYVMIVRVLPRLYKTQCLTGGGDGVTWRALYARASEQHIHEHGVPLGVRGVDV